MNPWTAWAALKQTREHSKYSSSENDPVLSENKTLASNSSWSMTSSLLAIDDLLSNTKTWVDLACASSSVVGSSRISFEFASMMQVTDPKIDFRGMPASKSAKIVALNAVERIYIFRLYTKWEQKRWAPSLVKGSLHPAMKKLMALS